VYNINFRLVYCAFIHKYNNMCSKIETRMFTRLVSSSKIMYVYNMSRYTRYCCRTYIVCFCLFVLLFHYLSVVSIITVYRLRQIIFFVCRDVRRPPVRKCTYAQHVMQICDHHGRRQTFLFYYFIVRTRLDTNSNISNRHLFT